MTLVLNMADVPLALTLTPIRVGAFIIRAIDKALVDDSFSHCKEKACAEAAPLVQLKWPNDVIINGEKVSGVLIEVEDGKLLIGIGVNITTAPAAPQEGPDSGCREATALSRHMSARTVSDEQLTLQLRNFLATELHDSARHWVSGASGDTLQAALDDFHLRMDDSWQVRLFALLGLLCYSVHTCCHLVCVSVSTLSKFLFLSFLVSSNVVTPIPLGQVLRRDHYFEQGFECGDKVKAVRLNTDGTLQVSN
jgi:hypothetical protein